MPPPSSSSQPLSSLLACNVYVSAGQKPSHERILLHLLRQAQSTCLSLSAAAVADANDTQRSSADNAHNGIITTSSATTREEPHHHAALLLDDSLSCLPPLPPPPTVLEQNERLILSLSSTKRAAPLPPVLIVHAYADPVYNRSSFHLAGTNANAIAQVASTLAITAVQMLRRENDEKESESMSDDCTTSRHEHPFVGHVDHISVMPLISLAEQNVGTNNATVDDDFHPITSASGWAARAIGKALEDTMTIDGDRRLVDEVYYYGDAHPLGPPLATVRRERTRFFRTGGCANDTPPLTDRRNNTTSPPPPQQQQVATVGAPLEFVENYNIRLTRHVSKAMAQSLTRHVRERNGGLVNVEALTLPYSGGRWEVACNLLRPNTSTTARHVEMAVQEWEQRQQIALLDDDDDDSHTETAARPLKLVEQCYRVGTTTEQCLQVLISCAGDNEKQRKHDEMVTLRLKEFLQQEI